MSCAIIVYFLTKTKSIWPAMLLLANLLVEMVHSHANHNNAFIVYNISSLFSKLN